MIGTWILAIMRVDAFAVDEIRKKERERGWWVGKRNKLAGARDLGCAEAMPGRSADLAGPNGLVLTW